MTGYGELRALGSQLPLGTKNKELGARSQERPPLRKRYSLIVTPNWVELKLWRLAPMMTAEFS